VLSLILASFGMGLLGSLHCLGMCGGLTAALGFGIPAHAARRRLILLTSVGRVMSYALIGLLAGALLQAMALGPWPRILAAIMLVLTGCYLAGWWNLLTRLEAVGAGLWRRLEPLRKSCLPIDTAAKALGFGLLWGALPCGLVYSAITFVSTASTGVMEIPAAVAAALGMLAFGLGTSPAVLIGGLMASELKTWLQKPLIKPVLGILYILFGLWTGYAALTHEHHGHEHHEHEHMQEPDAQKGHEHHHGS
jgi:uncharacterized protein